MTMQHSDAIHVSHVMPAETKPEIISIKILAIQHTPMSSHQQRPPTACVAAFHSLKFEAECGSYYCGVGVPGPAGAEEREGEAAGDEEWRLQGIETVFEGVEFIMRARICALCVRTCVRIHTLNLSGISRIETKTNIKLN